MSSLQKSASAVLFFFLSFGAAGAETLNADQLAKLVANRAASEGRAGIMHFKLQTQGGSMRERQALMIHSEREAVERIAIFFQAPAMIEETAFLSFNNPNADDEAWLYLPATERVRRLPASDRGDNFMGTDLSYGDVKDNFKFGLDDWSYTSGGVDTIDGSEFPVLIGAARTAELASEMGYGSFRARIDTETGFPVWIEYTDPEGEPLKQMQIMRIEKVGDVQTAMHFKVSNLQTGHSTEIHFTDMQYVPNLDESIFDPNALAYGIPSVN
jgi:hypothetical protein